MPSRLSLSTQARIWRGLENIGMGIERWTGPTQATHSFVRSVSVEEPFWPGTIDLYFYIPPSYINRKPMDRFPTFLNFHGGGFTIGDATDDARWGHDVIRHLESIYVSANYRLAPEFPYPVAVQDGACALQYLAAHAEELGIDTERVVTCGFSAGGTLSITAPMLYNALHEQQHQDNGEEEEEEEEGNPYLSSSVAVPECWYPEHAAAWAAQGRCSVRAFAAFYPAVDFTLTREQRRSTNPSPAHNLSEMLTGLFDASYLPLPEDVKPPDPTTIVPTEASKEAASGRAKDGSSSAAHLPLETPSEDLKNPTFTLTEATSGSPPPDADEASLSRVPTAQDNLLSRATTNAGLSASPTNNMSRTPSSISETPSENNNAPPKKPSLAPSRSHHTHPNPLSRTISSRSARPSPVKMSSGLLPYSSSKRSTSARPPLARNRSSGLSVPSFRSFQASRSSHQQHQHQQQRPGLTPRSSASSLNSAASLPPPPPHPALFDPFLSPAQASADMLRRLVPPDCVVYTCEYDMLQAEGERFAASLAGAGKRVAYKKVSKVPHAWDKSPGIISWGADAAEGRRMVAEVYREVCGVLGSVLGVRAKVVDDVRKEGRRAWLWRKGSSYKASGGANGVAAGGGGGGGEQGKGGEKSKVVMDREMETERENIDGKV